MTLRDRVEGIVRRSIERRDAALVPAAAVLQRLNELGIDDWPEYGFDPTLLLRFKALDRSGALAA